MIYGDRLRAQLKNQSIFSRQSDIQSGEFDKMISCRGYRCVYTFLCSM